MNAVLAHAPGCPSYMKPESWMCSCDSTANEKYVQPVRWGGAFDEKAADSPLTERLETVLGTLLRCMHVLSTLEHGDTANLPDDKEREARGVLVLGAECDKIARALENQVLIVAKRIGRL